MSFMSEAEYSVFASPDFDANEYANAVLVGEQYPVKTSIARITATIGSQIVKEDVSAAIARLESGIESVSKQLKNVVTTHHEELLVQAAGVNDLQSSLHGVRVGLDELNASIEKLRVKIRVPYHTLQINVSKLEKLHHASDVLHRIARFVVLARRLEVQMVELDNISVESAGTPAVTASLDGENEKERMTAKAALSIAELGALLDATEEQNEEPMAFSPPTIPLRSLHVVAAHIPFIDNARSTVTAEMESTILAGLTHLNQALLASSLQTAHNLRVLPSLVANLVTDLASAVESRIRSAFDMTAISKEMVAKEPSVPSGYLYKSRVRTEPTNVTQPQWANVLWTRLEVMIDEMAGCCIKVYTLERVLKLRRDHVTQVEFLEEAMEKLEENPTLIFWHALARALEAQIRDATKGSTFLHQTLSSGYTKFLRLFHDFFGKIALHTDTVYTQSAQSPETVLVLRALSSIESVYLSKCSIRLNEAIGQAFIGGARSPPNTNEAVTVVRAIANEMDGAKFDPILVNMVARTVKASIELLLSRVDSLAVRDRSAFALLGPAATPQQISNAQVASFIWHLRDRLARLETDHAHATFAILSPALEELEKEYMRITEPLLSSVRRELGSLIARLHKLDLGGAMDAGMATGMAGGSTSLYMRELVDKLGFVKTEIFANFNIGEARRAWSTDIAKYVLRTFTLHMSIARPLGEGGKLQLTTDMTELEFALSAFVVDPVHPQRSGGGMHALGDEYRMLRAMRPLLFLDNISLAQPEQTAGVPPLVVLHHVLVRSPLPLPHALHGWKEAEYVRWVAEHTQRDALALIEGGITRWERMDDEQNDKGEEYVRIARAVLSRYSAEDSVVKP